MIKKEIFSIPGARGRNMLMDLTYDGAQPDAPLVIFVHGFKGFKDWGTHNLVARFFAENGYRFLKFNFSHNGTTADQPVDFADLIAFSENTFSIELEDLNNVIDFACNGQVIPRARTIHLIGHSMGGGISIIQTAEDTRVHKLITIASIAGFDQLWPKEAEKNWRLQGVLYMPNKRTGQQMPLKSTLLDDLAAHPGRLNILARAAEIRQSWLITHAEADETVPVERAYLLKANNTHAELQLFGGGDHTFGGSHPYAATDLPEPLLAFCKRAIIFLEKA
jgi:pimeloyl-ACP methyl ester carboxylesterase